MAKLAALCLTVLGGVQGLDQACWSTTVLEDTATGWAGACLGLTQFNETTYTAATCADKCKALVTCSVWQLTKGGHCWLGVPGSRGEQCLGRDGDKDFKPEAAQRIQQGNIKVLKNYTTEWVKGLRNVGIFAATDGAQNQARCRMQCYSEVDCTYWMYGKDGCWMENPPAYKVGEHPEIDSTSDFAKTMVAGEHIVNVCPPKPKKEESFWTWPVIIGLALAALLLLAIIYFACCNKPKKVKKTRAVKVAPKKEPAAPVYTVLEPTYTTYVTPTPQYQVVPQETVQMPMMSMAAQPIYAESAPLLQSSVMAAPQPMIVAEQAPLLAAPVSSMVVQGGSVQVAQGGSVVMR